LAGCTISVSVRVPEVVTGLPEIENIGLEDPSDKATLVTVPPLEGVLLSQVVPFEVKTFPEAPGATKVGALVPFPKMTLFAVKEANPVPPPATELIFKETSVPVCVPVKLGKSNLKVVTSFASELILLLVGGNAMS
jgi:hypothetical protein